MTRSCHTKDGRALNCQWSRALDLKLEETWGRAVSGSSHIWSGLFMLRPQSPSGLGLLKTVIGIIHCKFKGYNVMSRYMYILQNYYNEKHPSPYQIAYFNV